MINLRRIKFYRLFGQRVKAIRKMYGWDKQAFQKKFGINRGSMSRLENGTHTVPLYTAVVIAQALNTSVLDLMSATEFRTPVTEENLEQRIEDIKRLTASQRQTIITLINQFLKEKDNECP